MQENSSRGFRGADQPDLTLTFPDRLTLTVFKWNKAALRSLHDIRGLKFSGVRRGNLGGDLFQFQTELRSTRKDQRATRASEIDSTTSEKLGARS